MTKVLMGLLVCLGCVFSLSTAGASKQVASGRYALLVGNQQGWKHDPSLRYALSGDVRPLASVLRGLGFVVETVENRSSQHLRRVMQRILRSTRHSRPFSTFLLYYSGHADQYQLHMGKRQKRPMRYTELAHFLRKLRARRRIAILDACYSGALIKHFGGLSQYKALFRAGRLKGVSRKRKVDLRKLLSPHQGKEWGIRIIASSLGLSWELQRYKASMFTYHLLRGLKGAADLDSDGKVSIDELFDFTSRQVKRLTGQRPQQMALIQREEPYALAPAYSSRLYIGPQVRGQIRVSVANFLWSMNKRKRKGVRLAVVNGVGRVFLKRKHLCWQQTLRFPKNGEARLPGKWQLTSCPALVRMKKGRLALRAVRVLLPPHRPVQGWQLAIGGGSRFHTMTGAPGFAGLLSTRLCWRWFGVGVAWDRGQPDARRYSLSWLQLQIFVGVPLALRLGRFASQLWLGGVVSGGPIWQERPSFPTNVSAALSVEGKASFAVWWTPHIGTGVSLFAGAAVVPLPEGASFVPSIRAQGSVLLGF